MKYILIDTNCWKHLLESDPKSEISNLLTYWLNENAITILMPEVIKDTEWPRMQQKHLQEVKKAHKLTVYQVDMTKSPLSGSVSHAFAVITKKIADVNKIIESSLYLKFSAKVSNLVMRRYTDRLPPFHTKEKSNDDGLIYYSSIEYLQSHNIHELVFISNDKSGFSSETDEELLHSKLEVPGITIQFYRNIHKAIHELKAILPKLETTLSETDIDYVTEFQLLDIPPPHVLDQLHSALNKYYDQIRFIPVEILRRIFPIKKKDKKLTYTEYATYSLGTNNNQLYELFASIEVKPNNKLIIKNANFLKGVVHAKKKLFEVCRKLNDNIVNIIFQTGGHVKDIDIELKDHRNCNCTRCAAYKLNFSHSLSVLEDQPCKEAIDTMKHGHIQFQFGNFSQSMRLFHHAYKQSVNEEKSIRAYICFYNLKRIKNYIRGYFQKVEDDVKDIMNFIEQSATIQEIYKFKDQSEFSQENIHWLKENKFYSEGYLDVTQTVEKIRDHYNNQLTGGWSSNSNIRILITKFVEYERYLNENFIIYQASEIMELFEPAMDGLLMAHAFNQQQSSRLVHFNDYLLLMMVKYSKAETIFKYFKRYNLKVLKYNRGDKKTWQLEVIAAHYFETYLDTVKAFQQKKEGEGYFFLNTLHRMTINLITVCSLAETKKDLTNKLIRSILNIAKEEKLIRKTEHQYLAYFLVKKGKSLDKQLLKELIETAITNEQFHDEQIFDALNKLVNKFHKTVLIDKPSVLDAIENFFMKKCPKCNELHYKDCLLYIYELVTPAFRDKIKEFIEAQVATGKEWDLFYMASMFEIIDVKKYIAAYLPEFDNIPKELPKYPSMFRDGREAIMFGLNELINLSIKFKLPIQDLLQKYKGISDYYDFIIDMDNFEYKKFKPEWVMEYQTSVYLEKIFGNEKVKSIMKKHLRQSKHPKMSQNYIEFTK